MKLIYKSPKLLLELTDELRHYMSGYLYKYRDYNPKIKNELIVVWYAAYSLECSGAKNKAHLYINIPRRQLYSCYCFSCNEYTTKNLFTQQVKKLYLELSKYDIHQITPRSNNGNII